MRRLTIGTFLAGIVGALAIMGLLLTYGPTPSAQAAGMGAIAIDTDITGNTVTPCTAAGDPTVDYPCNTSTTLGPLNTCASIPYTPSGGPGTGTSTIQIDIVGLAIPPGGTFMSDLSDAGAGQSDMALDWTTPGPTGPIAVSGKNFTVALIHQGDDDNPAGASDGTAGAASTSGHWKWTDVDANPDLVGEGGNGIAVRLTIKGINPGSTTLSLTTNGLSQPTFTDIHGNEYTPSANLTAQIFVGSPCPTGAPTPSPTPSPSPTPAPITPSPTPSPPPTPSPTPSPSPVPPFTPTYQITIDENDNPGSFLDPPCALGQPCLFDVPSGTAVGDDDCKTNTLPYPAGISCEMYQTTRIPAGQPLALAYTLIPEPKFTIASGHPALGGAPNGATVGAFGFTIGVRISGTCFQGFIPVVYPGVTLVDGALPAYTSGPWAGAPNGMPPEGPDVAGPAAVFSPLVWPTDLEADVFANSIHSSGAPLIARYFGVAPTGGVGTPVNILVFNTGTAYLTYTITGDPALPPSGTQFCTPFTTSTDYLGETTVGGVTYKLRQCNVVGPGTVIANFIRADLGTTTTVTDGVSCSGPNPSVIITKDEQLGDNNPQGDVVPSGAPSEHTITVTITNGPADLDLQIIGPAVCHPTFTTSSPPGVVGPPSIVGGNQISTIHISSANGVVMVKYSINCPPGDFCFQVTATITPPGPPDPGDNLFDNTAENHVCAHVVPGTDVSVTVTKDETFSVDTSTDNTKHVTIVVNNSGNTANVRVVITAISQVGQCEVRLVPHAGDMYSEYFTDEVAGPPNPDTLTSQIEFVIPNMASGSSQTFSYDYVIHCFQRSLHTNAFELQVDVLPLSPVAEQNLGIAQFPCGNGGHGIHDNVHKNCPTVVVFDTTDISKSGCMVTAVATSPASMNFNVNSKCTVTNNGTVAADVTDTVTLVVPADCTISPPPGVYTFPSENIPGGGSHVFSVDWNVQCSQPSNHVITANDTVSITTLHVRDTNAANNSATASTTVAITTVIDTSITKTCTSPASVPAGQQFQVDCTGNINLAGTVAGEFGDPCDGTEDCQTLTVSGPSDCSFQASRSIEWPATNGSYGEGIPVTCTGGSNHTFVVTNCITPVFPLHVSETNLANNCATSSTTTAVLQTCNLAVSVSAPAETDINGDTATITATANITSTPNCTVAWTVTASGNATGSGGVPGGGVACVIVSAASPANGTGTTPIAISSSFSAMVPAGSHECGFDVVVCADATAVHITGVLCNKAHGVIESNVLVAKFCLLVGPAAVNLSDTNGRYMWVICEVGNVSNTAEPVTISMDITPPVPAGCTRTQSLILPGASSFTMAAHEQKTVVFRVRFECHSPATATVLNQTVTFTVTHVNDDGAGDVETFTSDNTKVTTKQVIIQ